jgi:predicted ABC-type exoprotein transport system permease subunit
VGRVTADGGGRVASRWVIVLLLLLPLVVPLTASFVVSTLVAMLLALVAVLYAYPARGNLGWRWTLLPLAIALMYAAGLAIHAFADLPGGGVQEIVSLGL